MISCENFISIHVPSGGEACVQISAPSSPPVAPGGHVTSPRVICCTSDDQSCPLLQELRLPSASTHILPFHTATAPWHHRSIGFIMSCELVTRSAVTPDHTVLIPLQDLHQTHHSWQNTSADGDGLSGVWSARLQPRLTTAIEELLDNVWMRPVKKRVRSQKKIAFLSGE